MAISFTPCLRKKLKLDKEGIINIRITADRKSTYVSLKEKIHERFWNENTHQLRENKGMPEDERERINSLIEQKIAELKEAYKVVGDAGKVKGNSKLSFMAYLNEELLRLDNRGQIGTYKRYKTTYYHLKKYIDALGLQDLLFSHITIKFVSDFETHLKNSTTSTGTKLRDNSLKNYMKVFKRIYTNAIKKGHYRTNGVDAFVEFKYERIRGQQNQLTEMEIERIYAHQFSKDHPLFHTRNMFLFQYFCQGLRVSDLFTLRFENIERPKSRIEFYQFKTKVWHTIYINDPLLFILKEYIQPDMEEVFLEKHPVELLEGKIEKLNFYETRERYEDIARETYRILLEKTGKGKDKEAEIEFIALMEPIKERLIKSNLKVSHLLFTGLAIHAKKHPRDFIFPVLKNKDFMDVVFDKDTRLSKYQYNQLQSKEALYNKALKKLQAFFGIETKITSHVSRHTYATQVFNRKPQEIYQISKGLGHTNLKMTENYLKSFETERVDETNVSFIDKYNIIKFNK